MKFKKILWFCARIVIAGSILFILIRRSGDGLVRTFEAFDCRYLAPAFLLYLGEQAFGAARWRSLANAAGFRMPYRAALSLWMQANFFSLVIPGGSIGGDVYKAAAVTTLAKSNRADALLTILMDRIVGMIGLFAPLLVLTGSFIPVLMKVQIPGLPIDDFMRAAGIILLMAGCLAGTAMLPLFAAAGRIKALGDFWRHLGTGEGRLSKLVQKITSAVLVYRNRGKFLAAWALGSALFVHLPTAVALYLLLLGAGADASLSRFMAALLAAFLGSIAGLIPIFPSGVGGRDLAAISVLAAFGISAETAKAGQLVLTAVILASNLLGCIFFFGFRRRGVMERTSL
ncbi:MAG: lysylphosphatidylglycerol synthase transmembrane domain-containing protein [Victivallaceae bacterium]|nr:lysylphosphatidylglycerol synthase transmembrane domain-containing protein [Victivallaceae bacterium]